MEIRRLQAEDYALLGAAIESLIDKEERDGGVASPGHLQRALQNDACYFLVALLGSTPIAYLSAFRFPAIDSDSWQVYLFDIVVLEEHRRKGIASHLIKELRTLCLKDGVLYMWLGTSLENTAAQKAFEATGRSRVQDTYIEYEYIFEDGA